MSQTAAERDIRRRDIAVMVAMRYLRLQRLHTPSESIIARHALRFYAKQVSKIYFAGFSLSEVKLHLHRLEDFGRVAHVGLGEWRLDGAAAKEMPAQFNRWRDTHLNDAPIARLRQVIALMSSQGIFDTDLEELAETAGLDLGLTRKLANDALRRDLTLVKRRVGLYSILQHAGS